MIINNNIPAMNTHRQLGVNQNAMQNSMEKLSSGLRINRAGDDAAGLAISEKMRAQINGLDQASRNAQDGISLIQTAEGALNETHDILQRMRELSVQSANDTNADAVDRAALDQEFQALSTELTRIADETKFNGKTLLDGDASFEIHVGADAGQAITITSGQDASAEGLSVDGLALLTQEGADAAITGVQTAIDSVSTERSKLGAFQNRLEHTISNLNNSSENLSAAESRIRDVDMAKEMMEMTKSNILSQASQSMLAQANQQPQAVLQLLG
jgi:flagellin